MLALAVLVNAAIFVAFFAFEVFAVLQVMLWWGKPSWELALWLVVSFWMALFTAKAVFSARSNRE